MDRFGIHLEPLNAMLYQVGAFVPRLAIALVVVLAGWLIAKTVRFAVTKALRAINFNVLTERAGLDNFLRQGGWGGDTSSLFGVLAYWLVILAALLVAFNGLGLSYIADLLGRVVWFVPNLFVALLVLAFGSYFARFVGEAVSSYFRGAQMRDAVLLGQIARYAVMAFVILIALDQIKVGGDIVRESFLVVLAGVVFALALAFGLAGKDWAAAQIERWWPRAPKDRSATTTSTTTTTPTIVVEPGKGSSPGERPPR
ncbi:mechanosensitive ion channel family protein [Variovorax paradoxus]|uniref:mechanosensitive ion channel family protein n=1 Tax=Variovorax paradoxus TaxID=34073 RepID=UPI003D64DC5D